DERADVVRDPVEVGDHVLHGAVGPLGALQCLVGVVDVGLVVLVVVQAHRLTVDVRLESVVGVGQRRDLEGHGRLLPSWGVCPACPLWVHRNARRARGSLAWHSAGVSVRSDGRSGVGIEIRGLAKSFRSPTGPVHAVRGVDISIPRGETVALLGPNGAGKTTTIDMLLGLLEPDRGSVSVFDMTPADAIKAGAVGVMFQTGG